MAVTLSAGPAATHQIDNPGMIIVYGLGFLLLLFIIALSAGMLIAK